MCAVEGTLLSAHSWRSCHLGPRNEYSNNDSLGVKCQRWWHGVASFVSSSHTLTPTFNSDVKKVSEMSCERGALSESILCQTPLQPQQESLHGVIGGFNILSGHPWVWPRISRWLWSQTMVPSKLWGLTIVNCQTASLIHLMGFLHKMTAWWDMKTVWCVRSKPVRHEDHWDMMYWDYSHWSQPAHAKTREKRWGKHIMQKSRLETLTWLGLEASPNWQKKLNQSKRKQLFTSCGHGGNGWKWEIRKDKSAERVNPLASSKPRGRTSNN